MKLKHKEEYLTQEKRTAYLRELTPAQKDTLYKYKRYKINSELMTEINQDGTYWKLIYEEEYPYYNIHNPKDSP